MQRFRFGQRWMFEMTARWRIESVESALDYLDEFLPHAKGQALLRKNRELQCCTSSSDRELIEAELECMKDDWDGRLPAYFYGSLLVMLWGQIEMVIGQFAAETQSTKSIALAFQDINGRSAYSRIRKYTQAVAGIILPENSQVEDLQFLRNIYAHHGGDISNLSEEKKKRLNAMIRTGSGVSVSDSYVLVNSVFLRKAAGNATTLIEQLHAVHPSTEPPLVDIDGPES